MELGAVLFLLFLLPLSLGSPTALTSEIPPTVLASNADFAVSASPSMISIGQGAASATTMTVSGLSGYAGNVALSVAETYDSINVNVGLNPSFVEISAAQPSATSMLQVSASTNARPGDYTISLVADDGTIQHHLQIALQVTGQDFDITSTPTRLTFPVQQNTTLTANIIVSTLGGFSGDLDLTISTGSYYPGVTQTPSASPNSTMVSITPSAPASFQLTIAVNSSMIAAPYWAQIIGVAQSASEHSRGYQFNIIVGPDFNLTMTVKNIIVHQGAMSVATVTVTSLNGFQGDVGMYDGPISVNSPNPDIWFYPPASTLSPGGTKVVHLAVRADNRTGLGTYTLWIEASDVSGGWIGESLPFNVTVEERATGPNFVMYSDPVHLSTGLGSTVTSSINMIGLNGFTGPVTLFAGYGVGASLNPGTVSLSQTINMTSTLTVNIPGPTPGGGGVGWWYASGGYNIIVIASDPTGFSHWTWVNITATPFSVLASPAKQELKAGSTATFNLTVNGIGQFNDTVTLSTSGSQGIIAALSSSQLNFSAAPSSLSSNLTVNVLMGTSNGDYFIQVAATYMRPEYICTCAPKDPLTFTVPIDVLVTSGASSGPTIFGLQPIEFYATIMAVAGAVILASYLAVRRGRLTRTTHA